MKTLESLRVSAEKIVANEPIWFPIFPPEPWDENDLQEIAEIVEAFLLVDRVIDEDPWVDWLDRWKFYQSQNDKRN